MEKFRCLYISRYAPIRTRTDPYTGLPWYLSERINFVGLWGKTDKLVPFHENCERILETNPTWWGMRESFLTILRFMKEGNRLDAVVCGIDEYSLTLGLFVSKTTHLPVFCFLEDPPFTERYNPPIGWFRRREKQFRQFLVGTLLPYCSGILCFIEEDILDKFRLSDVPIYQLMNGVSPQALEWVESHPTKSKGDLKCTIGYIGAVSRRQGIDDLLEIYAKALQKVPRLQLRLIGPIESDYAQSYQRRLHDLGLNSSVRLTGWLPYDKMLEQLQGCHICVCCNPPTEWFRSAQPLKVCEYLALSKPTVAWNYPGVSRLLDGGRLGILVPPDNKSAFSDALVSLTDPTVRCSFEEEIRAEIQGCWSSDYWYGQVLDVLLKSGGIFR